MNEPSLVRRGLDALLKSYPHFDLVSIDWHPGESGDPLARNALDNPWVIVELGQPSEGEFDAWAIWRFSIWRTTGAVYRWPFNGAVEDEPIIEVEA